MYQGPPNPGFRSVKVENWDFLKKDSQVFKNFFKYLASLESKIRRCPFLDIHNCKKQCVYIMYNYVPQIKAFGYNK